MQENFVLRGDICYSANPSQLRTVPDGYLVCVDGQSAGVFERLPEQFASLPVTDHRGKLILPGLVDLHVHAPQFAYRGLGMDLELLDWLNTHAFPEESRYADLDYARQAYAMVVEEMLRGPNTRAVLFATAHAPATALLMDQLEQSGLVTLVGKVNMDRNAPDSLREKDAASSLHDTRDWLQACAGRYKNTAPILTPRFIPSCSDELLRGLAAMRKEHGLPLQSHLSENQGEIDWVRTLCPGSAGYADAYHRFGLLDRDAPVIMAHCVWSDEAEMELLAQGGAFVAHCPQSNTNISSGIAPVRRFLQRGLRVGLGSDVAGGCHPSIFRAMTDAIQVSKLRWRLSDQSLPPLTVPEAFYLGTLGGGAFFGKVGSFEEGYELDALILDDASLRTPHPLNIEDRLARALYLSDDRHIAGKYVRGRQLF